MAQLGLFGPKPKKKRAKKAAKKKATKRPAKKRAKKAAKKARTCTTKVKVKGHTRRCPKGRSR